MSDIFSMAIDDAGVLAALESFPATFAWSVHEALVEAVTQTVDAAQAACPVETGFLRDSITGVVGAAGMSMEAKVMATAYYAVFVELGHRTRNHTSFVPPEPFLGPAWELGQQTLSAALMTIVR